MLNQGGWRSQSTLVKHVMSWIIAIIYIYMYIILNYIRKPLVSEMVTAAPHHLICSIDLGAALQQQ